MNLIKIMELYGKANKNNWIRSYLIKTAPFLEKIFAKKGAKRKMI